MGAELIWLMLEEKNELSSAFSFLLAKSSHLTEASDITFAQKEPGFSHGNSLSHGSL
jgi:hypothetical protein